MQEIKKRQPTAISSVPTALVGGGAGFVGSFLCQSLLLEGCRVIALDNFLTGKRNNLKACLQNNSFQLIEHDLTQAFEIKNVPKIDYVFHVAGMEGNKKNPLDYLLVNSQGTKNLLEIARVNQAKFLLASSLMVFSAEEKERSLVEFFKKEKIFSHPEARQFAEEMTLEYFRQGVNARIVRLGWVYGPRMNLDSDRELTKIFKSALKSSTIDIPGNGEKTIHPTFVSDIVYGLMKAVFSTRTTGKAFNLVNPQGISLIDFAHKVQKNFPKKLDIKFVPALKEQSGEIESLLKESPKLSGWKAKVSVEEGIERTWRFFAKSIGEQINKEGKKATIAPDRFKNRIPFLKKKVAEGSRGFSFKNLILSHPVFAKLFHGLIGFILILAVLLLPFYIPIFYLVKGAYSLNRAYSSFRQGRIDQVYQEAENSFLYFDQSSRIWSELICLFPFGTKTVLRPAMKTTYLAKKTSQVTMHLFEVGQHSEEMLNIVLKGEDGNLESHLNKARVGLDTVWQELSFLEAELANKSQILSPKIFNIDSLLAKVEGKLPTEKGALKDLSYFLGFAADMLAVNGEKTYLILFQNNMELRPTGGFIGSFGLVSFKRGQLISFEVYDVYSADGRLKGYVKPPTALKEYLGEEAWYLRDSNWDPNFPTSAIRAEWFLEKTLEKKVDGVIAVNLNLPKAMLEVLGEIKLADFNESVDAANLFEKAQSYSENDFFPGSNQKRDFLGDLVRALIEEVKFASGEQQLKVAWAAYQSLKKKDILIFINDEKIMEKISYLGWGGSLRELNCVSGNLECVTDYLMVVEANLGVNKANRFLERRLNHQAAINQEGQITNTLQIDYINKSFAGSRFGGNYKNYLRIYTPLGSKLKGIKIGKDQLSESEIDHKISSEKTYFGFLVEVPAGQAKKVKIVYQVPFQIEPGQKTDYLFLWQRQSGADQSPLTFRISLPKKVSVFEIKPLPEKFEDGVWFKQILDRDLLFQTRIKI